MKQSCHKSLDVNQCKDDSDDDGHGSSGDGSSSDDDGDYQESAEDDGDNVAQPMKRRRLSILSTCTQTECSHPEMPTTLEHSLADVLSPHAATSTRTHCVEGASCIASAIISNQEMKMASANNFQVGNGQHIHGIFNLALSQSGEVYYCLVFSQNQITRITSTRLSATDNRTTTEARSGAYTEPTIPRNRSKSPDQKRRLWSSEDDKLVMKLKRKNRPWPEIKEHSATFISETEET
jgi:hypothetical protein